MSSPIVSVLTTSYNREDFIAESIEGTLASTFGDFELVVVDDCSTDGTVDIARQYENLDERVRVHVNDQNLGDYPNRNKAASLACGKYIKYVDSDDIIYPHGLEVMVQTIESKSGIGLGLSATAATDRPHPLLLSAQESYELNFFERDLLARAPGSAIINRQAFETVGGFSGIRQVGDHELWLRIAAQFPVITMPRDLVWDREHGQQEKHYDSIAEKTKMHLQVQLDALTAPECPLNPERTDQAIKRLRSDLARNNLRHALRGRLSLALALHRSCELRLADYFAS